VIEFNPARIDLAREFRARPFGAHSADLQAVLTRMRTPPIRGKCGPIVTRPYAERALAPMAGGPRRRPEPRRAGGHGLLRGAERRRRVLHGSIAYPGRLPHAGHARKVARLTASVPRRFVDPTALARSAPRR
jgi:hypothetical protein